MAYKLFAYDSLLNNYKKDIELRMENFVEKLDDLTDGKGNLSDFANGHHYFGLHRTEKGVVYREWAPGADELHVFGDFNGWNGLSHPMTRKENGVFEIELDGEEAIKNGQKFKVLVTKDGHTEEHIPTYATYVVQDPVTYIWSAEAFLPEKPFEWHDANFHPDNPPVIYECHIGMATEEYRIGTYREFEENVLPRIVDDGYNTIQVMAIMEHPYYASFGYQVANFFAASSRFGTPTDLKHLIDTAHAKGIRVLLDVVHSHACANVREGLNHFDGTDYQFFHEGAEGNHPAWGTKLFDYGKNEVLHFLLSNLKFWMEEYHFDGFRFDGVTSMLYHDHGLGESFDNYDKYFSMNTDTEAVTYLMLANYLVHSLKQEAMTIAEDMSGMPGMCLPIKEGGIGFDYRLSMGVPDLWIKLLKESRDEDWSLWQIWYELTSHRSHEKVIGYCESHDQALVGDKTIMFWLCDQEMYWSMGRVCKNNLIIDRGMALHKIIRLLTYSLAGSGYLNFMGNEFGHPEWIDFPREGNGWSYHYCRRQWSLADRRDLRYSYLGDFDKAMLKLGKEDDLLGHHAHNPYVHEGDKVLLYEKMGDVFAFNLNPTQSFTGYFVPTPEEGSYEVALCTDDKEFGGYGRIDHSVVYHAERLSGDDDRSGFLAYLPSRCGIVYRKVEK